MRKIRILAHISLDGVIQAPGGRGEGGDDYPHGGWTAPYRNAAGAEAVAEAQGSSFDLLLGRRTYDVFAGHWPKAAKSRLADGLNAATKYVVLLGQGKRFFQDGADPRELTLVSTKVVSSTMLTNTYRYVGSLRTESPAVRA